MSNYVYDYQVVGEGMNGTVNVRDDNDQLYLKHEQRSASNVALTLGFKVNIY